MGMSTPWGSAQHQRTIAKGITIVSTAGHGGIRLTADRNAQVHEAWRNPGAGYDEFGWYEEDCEAAIVACTFPDEFAKAYPEWTTEQDHATARNWFPDQYEKVYGVTLTGDDSYIRAEQLFHAAHANDLIGVAAWGNVTVAWGDDLDYSGPIDGHLVGVCARVGGRRAGSDDERWFLVDKDRYHKRGQFGYVIDTTVDIEVERGAGDATTKQVAA